MNVIVSGSASLHGAFSFDTVDGSGDQIKTVPVGAADTISIVFSEAVNVSAGDLKVIGMRTANVPTAAEARMPKLDATSWFAVFAPAKTPQPVVDRLTSEIQKITATPDFQRRAAEQGASADYMNPKQLGDFSARELARWGEVVKASKIEGD